LKDSISSYVQSLIVNLILKEKLVFHQAMVVDEVVAERGGNEIHGSSAKCHDKE
jgi:hypothetical protein